MRKFLILIFIVTNFVFGVELKTDSKLISGQLSNGLKYYIYPNEKPKNYVSVRLKVNAGSLYENPKEEGLAHFLEHLAFNGTEKYPKNNLVKALESRGVSFGHDINAYTSFDETVFRLDGQVKDLSTFLDILHQWGFKIKFTKNEVDKEKGVVIEEWRQNSGLNKELQDFYNKFTFGNSKYLDRMPIGKVSSIQNFTDLQAKNFYSKWYTPNNMILYIAGDISDSKKIVNQIEKLFGKEKKKILPNTEELKKRKIVPTETTDIFNNTELRDNSFSLLQIAPIIQPKNQEEKIKTEQIAIITSIAFNQRYSQKLNSLDTNLNSINYSISSFNDYYGFNELTLSLKNDKTLEGIAEGIKELREFKLGLTKREFEDSKTALINYYTNAIEEAKSQETSAILDNILTNDFEKYKLISTTDYYNISIDMIKNLNIDEINNSIKDSFSSVENYYLFVGPTNLTKEQVKKAVENGKNLEISSFESKEDSGTLITKDIIPGKINKEDYNKDLDFYTLTLSNGSKVYLKKTDYEKNNVSFYAVSKGGTSYVKTEDIPIVNFISTVYSSAPGSMNKASYERYLLSKTPMSLSYSLYDNSEYFIGSSNKDTVTDLLMNFYAFVTEPKVDSNQLEIAKHSTIEWLKNRNNSKDTEFWNAYLNEYYLNDPRDAILTEAMVNSVSAEKVLNLYKDRFSNGIDYDYYIVGDFDYDILKKGIETYLASLNTGKREDIKVLPEDIRTKNVTIEKNLGKGEESTVIIHYGKKASLDLKSLYFSDMLKQALDVELTKKLREEMSGVYGAYSSVSINKYYLDRGDFSIEFTCDPKRVQELIEASKKVIEKVLVGDISDETIKLLKESYKANYDRNYMKNSFYESYFDHLIFSEAQDLKPDEYNKLVTKENIANFLKTIYGGYEAKFILNPAKK